MQKQKFPANFQITLASKQKNLYYITFLEKEPDHRDVLPFDYMSCVFTS